MPAKFDKFFLLIIALLHLIVVITHGYSHVVADVENTAWQLVFIVLVVVFAPLASVYIAWRISITKGAGLFSLAMIAASAFGYTFHFVIDSPDLYSNVVGDYKCVFFQSALTLAIFEFVGFVLGTYIWFSRADDA